jgi:ADP-ribose pyrophosphatase YjhB (NUDIX family)
MHNILEQIKKLKALADTGLLYSTNDYDRERYNELREISFEILSEVSGNDKENLKTMFAPVTDYPTVKTDVRALVLSEDKQQLLLVRESADGKWSLPGGWADVGQSPKEVAVKEVKEETGLDVNPVALMAVFDKRKHPHPPQPFYVYKIVIYCEATYSDILKGFDVLDAAWHEVDNLPELSEDRILQSQIKLVYDKVINNDFTAYFD